jgi:hypothetical protein
VGNSTKSVTDASFTADVLEHVLKAGIAKAEGPVRVPSWPDRGLFSRVAVPVRCGGRLFGYLWLIDAALKWLPGFRAGISVFPGTSRLRTTGRTASPAGGLYQRPRCA